MMVWILSFTTGLFLLLLLGVSAFAVELVFKLREIHHKGAGIEQPRDFTILRSIRMVVLGYEEYKILLKLAQDGENFNALINGLGETLKAVGSEPLPEAKSNQEEE
ncbi:hypothetical protein EHO57_14140 [Leptospira langatensis]|uniref:Uncharacterized protein n=1 Tax=Leptospira langatensis TaxID=2484983 RepID=A0A5R2AT94_9LEPT|nr:hypothetical protein [Leptospira langatensis]TGJ99894.1 hypothetical protein EHO57_14140 [Leptospira langatensis]